MAVNDRGRAGRVTAAVLAAGLVVLALGSLARMPPGRARDVLAGGQSGSWWFPRGGPYVLAFDAPGPASLVIDGETFLGGAGLVSRRAVFESGVHRVVFTAPAGARLLWNPPWRNGPLEEVLPSSLSRDPPSRAELTAPGTDFNSAALAGGLLLVILWSMLRLGRPFDDGRIWGPGLLIFISAAVARVTSLTNGGPIVGEDVLYSTGLNLIRDLLHRVPHGDGPPVAAFFAGVGALAADGYLATRLIFAALGSGACVLTFCAGARLFGIRAGFFSGMTAALLPQLIGHGRIVGVETPSLFLITLAIWMAVAATQDDGDRPIWLALRLLVAGVAFGVAVATRVENAVLAPALLVAGLLPTRRAQLVKVIPIVLVVLPLAAGCALFALWPAVDLEPLRSLGAHSPSLRLLQLGVATTPMVILALAGLAGGLRAAFRRERGWLLVLVWLAAPLTVALLPARPESLGDVLPSLVPLAVAAGAGLDALLDRMASVAFLLGVLFVGYLVVTCTVIHPYYLAYYGVQVGGPERVAATGSFPFGARGEGVSRAIATVNALAATGAKVALLVEPVSVVWLRADLWANLTTTIEAGSEWIVVNAPRLRGFVPPTGATLVLDVNAGGASLARVYQLPQVTRGNVP